MGAELVVAVLGPVIGTFFGLSTFLVKRTSDKTDAQLASIVESVEVISHQVTALQVSMPTNYITKDELHNHIVEAEHWREEVREQIREIRNEVSSLRYRNH